MKTELQIFERQFAEVLTGSVVSMDRVMRYVGTASGKRLRPRLVFLSARLFGEINAAVQRTALFVELLHTATLIHDDVVDESDTRRGQASINAKWDNITAVLAGDYLLAKALLQLAEPSDSLVLKEMMNTAMAMSEGELLQLEDRSKKTEVRSKEYLDIIGRKTAGLIRACCTGGALAGTEEKTEDRRRKIELIGEFGMNLGLVFQMRDDLLDDDDPEVTALAEQLLPTYLDKALTALDALAPLAKDIEAWKELRALTLYCAERKEP